MSGRAAQLAEAVLPASERDAAGPVFREPWEAQAFALAVALHEAGLFTWTEWTETLARALAVAEPAKASEGEASEASYYGRWLAALEDLIVAKGVAGPERLAERKAAWERAARATPHGRPIALDNDPERRLA
jgi:nitrile hydratase accessory protein